MSYSKSLLKRFAIDGRPQTGPAYEGKTALAQAIIEKLKGKEGGYCNRSACLAPGSMWWNWAMRAYYCAACAKLINEANADMPYPLLYPSRAEGEKFIADWRAAQDRGHWPAWTGKLRPQKPFTTD